MSLIFKQVNFDTLLNELLFSDRGRLAITALFSGSASRPATTEEVNALLTSHHFTNLDRLNGPIVVMRMLANGSAVAYEQSRFPDLRFFIGRKEWE